MPVVNADESSQLIYAGGGPYLVVNLDTADTVYIGQSRTVHTTDVPLPPQASAQLEGAWYVSTTDANTIAELAVLPGSDGGYSNPVGVQIALSALGLAKDTSVLAVNSTLGSPAQNATLTGGGALAQPAVPNMQFASVKNLGPNVGTGIIAPGVPWRLWAVWISYAALSNNSYTVGLTQFFASVQDSLTLDDFCGIELAVDQAGQLVNDTLFVDMPGIPFTAADVPQLQVNGGTGPANTSQRASAGVMYSTP